MADHVVLLRDHRQLLKHLLADAIQCLTTGTVRFSGVQVVDDVHAWQLRWQGVAGLLAQARMRRNVNLFVLGFIFGGCIGSCQ